MMDLFEQYHPHVPTVPDEKTRLLRAKLIWEEANEAVEALGCKLDIRIDEKYNEFQGIDIILDSEWEADLSHIAKELADVCVVTYGAAAACGIILYPIFDAVHDSNMSKLHVDEQGKQYVKKNEFGKVIKGPNYAPPNIDWVLSNQPGQMLEASTKQEAQ